MLNARFGPRSAICYALISLTQVALLFNLGQLSDPLTILWLAMIWSGWAIALWLLVQQPISLTRTSLILAAYVWHCSLLSLGREEVFERYMLLLGCYGLFQSLASFSSMIPGVQLPGPSRNKPSKKSQFSILTLSLITTCLAIVLFAAREYSENSMAGQDFVVTTLFTMPLLLLISITAARISIKRRFASAAYLLVLLTAISSASLMLWVEHRLQGNEMALVASEIWGVYVMVTTLMGSAIYLFGRLAMADADDLRKSQASETSSDVG